MKAKEITCSDWEQDELSSSQIEYAAADAIAAILILTVLVSRKLSRKRGHWTGYEDIEIAQPLEMSCSSSTSSICSEGPLLMNETVEDDSVDLILLLQDEAIKCAQSLCQGLIGTEFKQLRKESIPLASGGGEVRSKPTTAYSVRKTPLYYNCQLIGPDGTLLSTVDQKKVDWYIAKGLGGNKIRIVSTFS